jgi:hypothetical protein
MSERSLSRKGRLTAVCMFVCALIIVGTAVTGVLQLRWPAHPPVAHCQRFGQALGIVVAPVLLIVEKLNMEINAVLADPTMEARIANFGYTAFASSSAEFGKFIAEDIEKWAKVVKFAGIKPE